ncbi:e3 ubiquitin-protein ligase trim [Anaeramoeba flamelloides]|uniref:E3 ubiquitin-protein ligase trim n=1 Tax=Anaeramoeba flamelloides TaxID=1746091 RepID=A0ABQ8X112_9EUKA|nr:e3 ubiquitin-protein ligase trim [Anaeramoeba flamelloides]
MQKQKQFFCKTCQTNLATVFCFSCKSYFCGLCGKKKHSSEETKSHKLHPLFQTSPIETSKINFTTQPVCKYHDLPSVLYCKEHGHLICEKCKTTICSSHPQNLISFQSTLSEQYPNVIEHRSIDQKYLQKQLELKKKELVFVQESTKKSKEFSSVSHEKLENEMKTIQNILLSLNKDLHQKIDKLVGENGDNLKNVETKIQKQIHFLEEMNKQFNNFKPNKDFSNLATNKGTTKDQPILLHEQILFKELKEDLQKNQYLTLVATSLSKVITLHPIKTKLQNFTFPDFCNPELTIIEMDQERLLLRKKFKISLYLYDRLNKKSDYFQKSDLVYLILETAKGRKIVQMKFNKKYHKEQLERNNERILNKIEPLMIKKFKRNLKKNKKIEIEIEKEPNNGGNKNKNKNENENDNGNNIKMKKKSELGEPIFIGNCLPKFLGKFIISKVSINGQIFDIPPKSFAIQTFDQFDPMDKRNDLLLSENQNKVYSTVEFYKWKYAHGINYYQTGKHSIKLHVYDPLGHGALVGVTNIHNSHYLPHTSKNCYLYDTLTGDKVRGGSWSNYGKHSNNSDNIIEIILDMDNKNISFSVNGYCPGIAFENIHSKNRLLVEVNSNYTEISIL